MNPESIYSRKANGKLLITGEYFVLDGTDALAFPTKLGQSMNVKASDSFQWTALDYQNNEWLNSKDIDSKEVIFLKNIISKIEENSNISSLNKFTTQLDFPREWGLGSSSTLIALLADFFKINPYELNQQIFKGSGYDIACAFSDKPIIYNNSTNHNPSILPINIADSIKPYIYYLYLGNKQNSREGIEHYRNLKFDKAAIQVELSALTNELVTTKKFQDWQYLLENHETIISKSLKLDKISQTSLKGLPYFVKSLGAWGGDFTMIITDDSFENVKKNVKKLELNNIFRHNELIL